MVFILLIAAAVCAVLGYTSPRYPAAFSLASLLLIIVAVALLVTGDVSLRLVR